MIALDFNPILFPDSYKQSHYKLYPTDMVQLSAYIEPRFGANKSLDAVSVFTGIQYFVMKYLMRPVTAAEVEEAAELMAAHGEPFNKEGWDIIVNEYNGLLPVRIEALPEGTVHKVSIPEVQITTQDPRLAWLATYIETALLRAIWYPSTVATNSFLLKVLIAEYLEASSDTPADVLPFMLHDFGGRGATSGESAMIGGMAHLINFMGTDTSEALMGARRVYGEACAGYSIPAIEHSAVMAWGPKNEADAIRNEIEAYDGEGRLFSFVSDTYDLWNFIDNILGVELRQTVESMKGKLVVRPDSGDPVETPVEVVKRLWNIFGGNVNSKGYKVLNPRVGVIQGDGMDSDKIARLYSRLLEEGFSAQNCAVGMGGGLLQKVLRDDLGYAMKANCVERTSNGRTDIQKKPSTDATKTSKPGLQAVVERAGRLVAVKLDDVQSNERNLLEVVYDCGQMLRKENLGEIRARAGQAVAEMAKAEGALRKAA